MAWPKGLRDLRNLLTDVGGLVTQIGMVADRLAAGQQVLHVQDQKPQGTSGGAFTGGAWRVRDLNTIIENSIPGAGLANNQITLPTGIYEIDIESEAYNVSRHRLIMYNVSDSKIEAIGVNKYNVTSDANSAKIKGQLKCVASKVFEIRHVCHTTGTFGVPMGDALSGFGVEVYSNAYIRRIA